MGSMMFRSLNNNVYSIKMSAEMKYETSSSKTRVLSESFIGNEVLSIKTGLKCRGNK